MTRVALHKIKLNRLRFTIEKKNHINYRIDWAVGRAGHTLIIGVSEAF